MSGLVRAGTLRALATTGAQRSPLLPDVPTVAEAGYPALEFAEWFGIFVPVRTPNGTVETLSSVLRTALQTKEMQAGLANQSGDVGGLTPADFALQIGILVQFFDDWRQSGEGGFRHVGLCCRGADRHMPLGTGIWDKAARPGTSPSRRE